MRPEPLDQFVGTREFADVLDISTRTLSERIKKGRIPAPDRPARRLGEGHKWLRSVVQRVLAAETNPVAQPAPSRPDQSAA
jgi:hypothetical protein